MTSHAVMSHRATDRPQSRTTSAFRRLLAELRPTVLETVDVLHVAAILESRGVTDQLARERYGSDDVFALALRLRSRAMRGLASGDRSGDRRHPGARPAGGQPVRWDGTEIDRTTTGHGAIYLLPALSMPALLAIAGATHGILALIVGGAVGWFWAAITSWRSYAEWSARGQQPAQLMLAQFTVLGVLLGVGAGLALVLLAGLPPVVGVICAAVTAAQVSTTLLFFRGLRALLVLILLVPAVLGLAYLVAPDTVPARPVLLVFVLASLVALAVGVAPLVRRAPSRWSRPTRAWVTVPGTAWVVAYAVASVAFLLLPQAVVLRNVPHGVMALVGLFLAMGIVEWRAALLSSRLRHHLTVVHDLAAWRWRAAWWALRESVGCLLVTLLLSALVLWGLREVGLADARSVLVALAGVLLGAAYLLAQVLANAGAYRWLAGAFGLGVVLEGAAWPLGLPIIHTFVAAAGVVLLALFAGLLTTPIYRYR